MEFVKLSNEECLLHDATHRITLDYNDAIGFTSGVAAQVLPASGNLPAGTFMRNCYTVLETAFDGGDTSALTIEIGDGSTANKWLASQQIHYSGTPVSYKEGTAASQNEALASAQAIYVELTATGTITQLDTGKIHIFLKLVDPRVMKDELPHA